MLIEFDFRLMRDAPFITRKSFQLKDVPQIIAAHSLPKGIHQKGFWYKNTPIAFLSGGFLFLNSPRIVIWLQCTKRCVFFFREYIFEPAQDMTLQSKKLRSKTLRCSYLYQLKNSFPLQCESQHPKKLWLGLHESMHCKCFNATNLDFFIDFHAY